ncbi:VanZ family protein [Arthrobacter sp. zg-Y820]|uniref:VanZ family protein n=1 Tax=unclassified Arthrobacter TaxID=235627 RepID=UPI001E2A2278|nr:MULTISPECIES: VanZ family protein [unclassified Arthrobacter]MCC9198003.1 VanZ family protein [Arthrobacter sp. zg-Y820]MDK1280870.1 VanZ family protein [Arthrobacter sp. zg.Y820]WIB10349.1 VanZ family protein [Arthrobacter sp. zg-Y820]
MAPVRDGSARRAALWTAASGVLAVMAAILLWPAPVDRPLYGTLLRLLHRLQDHGLPGWVDYAMLESAANVLLFIPLGALVAALLPPRRWWFALLLCAGFAAGMEGFQDVYLPHRQGNAQDVLLNAGGALLGLALTAAGRGQRSLRRRRRRPPAASRRSPEAIRVPQ